MNINFLTSSRFSSRLVAILIIVLIQLPAVSLAFDFRSSIDPAASIFEVMSPSQQPQDDLSPLVVFSNSSAFTVADRVSAVAPPGVASIYPSPIAVAGLPGTISDVNVTISGLTAARPRDLDFLLVSPGGQTLVLMADAGDLCAVSSVNITFDDSAANSLPDPTAGCPPGTPISTGSWKPTNYVFGTEVDTFPAPAPAGPYNHPAPAGAATLATAFNGQAPNGTWNLYVVDDSLGGGISTVAGGWSIDITTVGGIDPTSTSIVSNLNPALTTQSITFTSTTINSTTASAVTTGTVTFTNNGVNIVGCVAVAVNASGQAACTTTLAEGTRTITANYSGTVALGVSSGSVTQVVNSPTVVAGAQFCNNGGLTITDAGTSAPVYPSTITVAGLVGTISKVTVQINGFTAPRPSNIDFLLVGANNAGYLFMSDVGDAVTAATNLNFTFDDAAGGQLPQNTAIASGTYRPTDYNVGADPFPAPAPASFSLAAPAGAATFASVYNSSNPNGNWRLFAVDDGIGGGNSTVTSWCVNFTVAPFATTTAVTSSADPSVFGQPVTFTATVSTAGFGTPTGNVQFFDGATPIGSPVALNGSGQAQISTSSLSVGDHTITAQYAGATVGAGGGGFSSSTGTLTSNPQTVNKANTTTTVVSSANPVGTGIQVTFTATVSPVAPGAGTRTGTVTFFRNGVPVCSNVAINGSGQASCNITFTIAGNYNITAQYSGDTNFNASATASPLVQQVLGPTAANVNVSGRVLDLEGRGVPGARVSMQNQEGQIVWAISNPFGYYRFTDVPSGQIYLVSVADKRYAFESRTINLSDDLTGLDFIASPGSRPTSRLGGRTPRGDRSP